MAGRLCGVVRFRAAISRPILQTKVSIIVKRLIHLTTGAAVDVYMHRYYIPLYNIYGTCIN